MMDGSGEIRQDDGQAPATVVFSPLPPSQQQQPAGRKKGTACTRCRSQKTRCDDRLPACANCAKAGQPCIRAKLASSIEVNGHTVQVAARLRYLEDALRRVAPEELEKAPAVDLSRGSLGISPAAHESDSFNGRAAGFDTHQRRYESPGTDPADSSPSAASTHIQPTEPLAHEVGLLSLENSRESKYLGPSSGVPFARLIFSTIPQSQGLSASWDTPRSHVRAEPVRAEPFSQHWSSDADLDHFIHAYFEAYQPLFPFLDEDAIADQLEKGFAARSSMAGSPKVPRPADLEALDSPTHAVQILLIAALGAKILEGRLGTDFSSERYLATAMLRVGSLALHDSVEGLQIMLLLTLSGFCFENGPNAWYLTSSIIASCLDLGLQRRWLATGRDVSQQDRNRLLAERNVRSGIFWSAYSLERTLAVVLGRPLTLRDEAIDLEFPGVGSADGVGWSGPSQTHLDTSDGVLPQQRTKRARIESSPYAAARYSFSFDRITAEIKLMLYRVVNSPSCFPWPTNTAEWQRETHRKCDELLAGLTRELKRRPTRSVVDGTTRALELKYHHCIMLLHRPSPAIPRPSFSSLSACYSSAMKTILINSDLHRFSKLTNTWLTAHTVFVSGITFLYCLWISPRIKAETALSTFTDTCAACTNLLHFIAKTWSVATDAALKFGHLVQLTLSTWSKWQDDAGTDSMGREYLLHRPQASQPLASDNNAISDAAILNAPPHNYADQPNTYSTMDGASNEQASYAFEPEFFLTELGDMSSWFDLNWMAGPGHSPPPDMTTFPGQ